MKYSLHYAIRIWRIFLVTLFSYHYQLLPIPEDMLLALNNYLTKFTGGVNRWLPFEQAFQLDHL